MNLPTTYGDRATAYAQAVVTGEILACEWVRLACNRHLSDLDRQGTPGFPYVFNPVMLDNDMREFRPVERVCYYIEQLPHVKGKWAREKRKIVLEDWQVFVEGSIFGWINAETGLRRFKTAYIEVPRKNAKTTLCSGNGLYLLTRDDEVGAEVYSAATTADQARISWSIAKTMVDKSPGMQRRFGVKTFAHSIAVQDEGSLFQYLASDSKGLDGLNISGAIIDELHAHKTREVWDVIDTGTGSREQPLLFIITTAGSNQAGICYEQRTYVTKLLQVSVEDETFFGIIYTIDKDDDWTDPKVWAKANPNYGVSVSPEDLERKANKAKAMPSAQNNFKTKHLNVWVNADESWMNMQEWDACGDPLLSQDDFVDDECVAGLDLSSKIDIAARVDVYKRVMPTEVSTLTEDGVVTETKDLPHYYAFGHYYLPEDTVKESKNDVYSGWVEQELLQTTPGNVIDFDFIEEDLKALSSHFQIKEVPYDPFQATQLSTRMIAEGFPMVEMRPTVLNFSEPMKELEALVLQRRFHHTGDPILSWMISNVVCHRDAKDNIYPNKQRPENKIDGVISLIMALGRYITTAPRKESVYKTRGIVSL